MTKAMILAAGLGERLRPLTDVCPKPLLTVDNKPLIVFHLERLKRAGIDEVVINLFHLGEQIEAFLGNGEPWGLRIHYSREKALLGTGGGVSQALSYFGGEPFILLNGDVWTDFELSDLPEKPEGLGHLVLVENPPQHPKGDFAIRQGRVVRPGAGEKSYTYSGIAFLDPKLFTLITPAPFSIVPLYDAAISQKALYANVHHGVWTDVGTKERLDDLVQEQATLKAVKLSS